MLIFWSNIIAAGQQELKFTLKPVFDGNQLYFRIDLKFRGEADGTTNLILPNRWGGQPKLYQGIKNLTTSSPNAKISDTDEPHIKIITHRPNQILQIRYELVQDFTGNLRGEIRYRPALQRDFFHLIGHGIWVLPQWNETEPISISLDWEKIPKSWTLAGSFGVNKLHQRFDTTLEGFIHSIFVGGNFRLKSDSIKGKPVNVAIRGKWKFTDEEFADLVRRIIRIERDFWKDYDAPYYLVTLTSLEAPPDVSFSAGTGLTNSFALFYTDDARLDNFKGLLAHEYFHNWNSLKLGRLVEPIQGMFWFSEGFTDYYAYLLLLRSGLISLDEYLQRYNRFIREYYLSPVREAENRKVIQDFWNDDDMHDLPYRRGFLLATNWNALIRNASGGKNSLDDVMLDLFKDAKADKPEITQELIDRYVSRYAGRSILPDIRQYVENGKLIVPDKDAFGSYVQMELVEERLFEPGLDLETLVTKKIIAGVKEDSTAYLAGLRDGQTVVRRLPIYVGDATKPIEITIKDGESEKTIKYFPASRKTFGIPQYKLKSGITEKERAEVLQMLGNALTKQL